MIHSSISKMKVIIAFIVSAMIVQSCTKNADVIGSTSSPSSSGNAVVGQIVGKQEVISLPISQSGNQTQALLWLPQDYSQTKDRYPLIISLHGLGAGGTDISNILKASSLADIISKGFVPEAINPIDHKLYKYIAVSPQAATWSYWSRPIKYMLQDLVKRYRVDTTRVYVVGYSAGGYGVWTCVTDDTVLTKKIAAIVPMDAAHIEDNVNVDGVNVPRYKNLDNAAKFDMPVWNICGEDDTRWVYAVDYTNRINRLNPKIPVKLTGLPGVGHSGWHQGYDPTWRVDGMNMYEWLLQYTREPIVERESEVKLGVPGLRLHPRGN